MRSIGVLALQGAVTEHLFMLQAMGVRAVTVKRPADLETVDALVIPGGESTVISRLIDLFALRAPLKVFAKEKAIMGTCAGLILCAKTISGHHNAPQVQPLGLMPTCVSRNGFGRQKDSFESSLDVEEIGKNLPAVFIRAPYIERAEEGVLIMARVDDKIVMARYGSILVSAFHPELTNDLRIMDYFCRMIV